MKNLPEDEWMSSLGKRLRDYSEEPDDALWHKISSQTAKQKDPVWMLWIHRGAAVISALMLLWALQPGITTGIVLSEHEAVETFQRESGNKTSKDSPADDMAAEGMIEPSRHPVADETFETHANVLSKETLIREVAENDFEHVVRETLLERSGLNSYNSTGDIMHRDEIHEVAGSDSLSADTTSVKEDAEMKTISVKQDQRKTQRRRKPFTVYARFAPLMTYQKVTPVRGDGIVVSNVNVKPVLSAERLGFSLELGVQRAITERIEIYGGLSLYHQSQTFSYQYQSGDEMEIIQRSNFEYELSPAYAENIVHYDMLNFGAQAGMLYTLKDDKLLHKLGGGIAYENGFLKTSARAYNNGSSRYLFYQLFYRSEYPVNNRFRIFMQPFYSHAILSDEALDEPFTLKPYRAGIGFGIVHFLE